MTRSLRRIAVVTTYAAYLAGAVMQWRAAAGGENREIILALFLASFAVGTLLFVFTHYLRWTAAKDAALDEREIATRNTVYRTAYSTMGWLSVALVMVWYLAPRPVTLETNINVVFWGYVLVLCTLPAALLAWKDRPAT